MLRFIAVCMFSVFFLVSSTNLAAAEIAAEDLKALSALDSKVAQLVEAAKSDLSKLSALALISGSQGKLSNYSKTTGANPQLFKNLPTDDQKLYAELMKIHSGNQAYGLVFVGLDDGGFVQAPEGDTLPAGYDPRLRPWYTQAMKEQGNFNTSNAYLSTTGEWVVAVIHKLHAPSGALIGLAGIDLDLSAVVQAINKLAKNKTDFVVIYENINDIQYIISAARNDDTLVGMGQEVLKALEPMDKTDHGVWRATIDGQDRTITCYSFKSINWQVAIVAQ